MSNDIALRSHSTARISHRPPVLDAAIVVGAGLALGTYLSRVLAEAAWVTWPYYRWSWTAVTALAVSVALYALWRTHASRPASGAPYLSFYLLLYYVFARTTDPLVAAVLFVGTALLFLLFLVPRTYVHHDRWIALFLFGVAMAAYVVTLTPAVGTRDGYELQAISATLGYAHPTGYPLFPIVGRLWLLIFPFGSIAWRINVLCALFAALSVPLLYGTAQRVLRCRPFAALSALLFAFSDTLWTQAVRPEKYTFNAFFVALILYMAFAATNQCARTPHPHLRWLAFTYGLSLGHHRTMLMLGPALALYVLWRDPDLLKRPREWLTALVLALVPLLIYLYIPWRAAVQGWVMSPSEFVQYISGTYYGPAVRLMDWANPERVRMFWRFLHAQYGHVGIALGIVGIIGLGLRRQWKFLACTALAYAAYYFWGTVWYAYYNDVNSFIPNHMIFATWIGSGVLALWRTLNSSLTPGETTGPWRVRRIDAYVVAVLGALVALLPLSLIWTNAPQVDASDEWNLTQWGAFAIAQDVARGATVLADREKHPPLDYFARIEGRRPDIDVVILGDERAYLDRLAWDLAHDKTVYLARFLPGLEGRYHLRSLGPLVEVGTAPLTQVDTSHPPVTDFGPHIQLLSSDVNEIGPLQSGDTLHVTLHWRAVSSGAGNYQVNLRLVGHGGQVWWTDSEHPVSGTYPTAAWRPGEVIPDWHEVPMPQAIPPGTYRLELGLFPPFATEGLVNAQGETWLTLHHVEIIPGEAPPIPNRLRALQPGQWQLLGYDLPAQVPPTGQVSLTLYWQAIAPLPDLEIGTRLIAPGGAEEGSWTVPGRGEYPSSRWRPGQTVVTQHALTMPPESGEVTVQVALRASSPQTATNEGMLSFYPAWLAAKTEVLSLPSLNVAGRPPAAPGTHNFGNQILLLETELQQHTLSPGTPLELSALWECVQAMDVDYTLFVQLLAPDGRPRGQIDVWPKNGTQPTSTWRVGELIEDRYVVYLSEDAPPGQYQVSIGWYLLETMQRIPVLDAQGNAIDDKVLISTLAAAR